MNDYKHMEKNNLFFGDYIYIPSIKNKSKSKI